MRSYSYFFNLKQNRTCIFMKQQKIPNDLPYHRPKFPWPKLNDKIKKYSNSPAMHNKKIEQTVLVRIKVLAVRCNCEIKIDN